VSPDLTRAAHTRVAGRGNNPDGPLSQAISMVGTGALLCLGGSGLDSLLGTGPILLIVFACLAAAAIFASAYYRYEARIRVEEASQPWARRSAP